LKNAAHVNLFILDACPVPGIALTKGPPAALLTHSALRLSCNHEGFAGLWREVLGDDWREPRRPRRGWPVLRGEDDRWLVRAAIDAVVAEAYGLSREQYAHVLSAFNHKSYPKAPEVCLAAFDELTARGLEAFCRAHDPYWDVPLKKEPATPAIDALVPERITGGTGQEGLFADVAPRRQRRGRRSRAREGG
jgi:hypothetical protein